MSHATRKSSSPTPDPRPPQRNSAGTPPRSIQTLKDLTLDPQNANRGTPRGQQALAHSLSEFGAARSIVADRLGRVIAGNKTVTQATTLGLPVHVVQTTGDELVVVQRVDLDLEGDDKARRLAFADNRTSEIGLDWDLEQLRAQFEDGLDLSELWTEAEREQLFGEGLHPGPGDADAITPPRDTTIQRGDLFALGPHRLLCGDATSPADVERLLDGAVPVLMACDPPYGVFYNPAWRATVRRQRRTAIGRVANDHRADWSAAFALFPGDIVYSWHAGLFAGVVGASLEACGFDLRAQIIWVKSHFAMSRGHFHWKHEPCWFAVRRGSTAHWCGDRTQTTVWEVPTLNPIGGGGHDAENPATGHGTQKPVRLFELPILNHTTSADAVYDPFCGSGTAVIAAQKTGRRCLAMDIDPAYVQATLDRWEAYTGARAEHLGGGSRE